MSANGSTGREAAKKKVGYGIARLLDRLPDGAQVALSRKQPVRIDGQTLDPGIQLALSILERRPRPPLHKLPLERVRQEFVRQVAVTNGTPAPVGSVRDLTVDGAEGPLPARLYSPDEPGEPHPLLVFFHGGGFVLGDLDTHDAPCRLLCRHGGTHVLSVDYRLAPEHPFPAAVEDALAALRWGLKSAADLGADPARVAVGGDSAGANLAAVAALLAVREGGPAPMLQALFYPATEMHEETRSRRLFARGFLLDREMTDWFGDRYAPGADTTDWRLSVLRADGELLRRAAPALVVTAGFDPLRDEGEAYAQKLRSLGVPAVLRRYPALIHGFLNATGTSRASRDASVESAGMLRALLATLAHDRDPGRDEGSA